MQVAKIGSATFETPDFARQLDYYSNVLGLSAIDATANEAILACPVDGQSVVLRRGDHPRCMQLTLELAPSVELKDVARELKSSGIAISLQSDPRPDAAQSLLLTDPDGLAVELLAARLPSGRKAAEGIKPRKLGHIAFKVANVQKTVDFYVQILGFRVSDWMGDFFAFLRCGPDHHTVNFLAGPAAKMHHIAFETEGWDHIRTASDFLARHKIPIIWGPGRHGIGHNIFIYHRNPDGQIVELYTDLDQMTSEDLGYFEPRPWHEDRPQRPKVWDPNLPSNVWGPPIPEGFRDG